MNPEEIAAISHASTQITALVAPLDNRMGARPVQLPNGIVMVTNRCIGSNETAADRSGLLTMPGCAEFMHFPFYLSRDRNLDIAASSHPLACPTEVPLSCANSSLSLSRTLRLFGWIGFFVVAFAIQGTLSPLHADAAKNYFKQGKQAEIREDYITAYQDYRQAWLAKPKDMEYKEAYTRLRFQAAAQYVEMAKKLRDQGQLNDALTDFLRALEIDPTYEEARQEADRLRARINGSAPQAEN